MIIEKEKIDVIIEGEDNSKKAKISENKLAKLQYLLTKGLYKDPITAVIAEWTNNGIDSVVQAGKNPIEHPVIVTIGKNEKGIIQFSVEDKGTGLDDRDFEDICMNYLESTKESDNDTIGHFGIGMKSFLSLERPATFTCRKNGKERKYLVYEGKEFVNYDLLYEKDTKEENGVKAELVINNNYEEYNFVDKAKSKLAYYDTVVIVVNGRVIESNIYRNDLFQWSTLTKSGQLHLTLKDVYYPIDWDALGIKIIDIPVALRLSLSDGLSPTPSRESYITNEKTKSLLLDKIKKVGDWFVEKYNEKVGKFSNLIEAYDFINAPYYNVKVNDTDFRINSIVNYATIKIKAPVIPNAVLKDSSFYKSMTYELMKNWTPVGLLNSSGVMNAIKVREISSYTYHIFHYKNKVVLVNDFLRGNFKSYLKQKYKSETLFVKKSGISRPLSGIDASLPTSFEMMYHAKSAPKEDLQKYSNEWNTILKDIESTFADETATETSKDYLDWVQKKKEEAKMKRVKTLKSGISSLKGKEDVTLAYSYFHYSKLCFQKKVYKVENLLKNNFVTVLIMNSDDLELAKFITSLSIQPTVKFATVGSNEYKKLPKSHHFKTFKEFMTNRSKPFMRIASALKFYRLLEDYKKISNFERAPFKYILKDVVNSAAVLEEYVKKNLSNIYSRDNSFDSKILDFADENNAFDKSCWEDYLKVKNAVKNYDFLPLLKDMSYYSTLDDKQKYTRAINQLLLYRKKTYKDFPEDVKLMYNGKEFLTK